ncbi:MAG: hypothetical protein U9P79_00320 [Candidatus Cloacimonadota bacterium]|nr:hypothetical protein [Candidatus Cloacimonadota bacterium]
MKFLECINRVNVTTMESHYGYSAIWDGNNEQGKQIAQKFYFYKVAN